MKAVKIVCSLLVLLFSLSIPAFGAEPTDSLSKNIDEFIGVLKSETATVKKTDEIWAIIEKMFIFEAVARLSVGQYWDKFSEPQKSEFTKYFTKLLGNSYLKKIRDGYTNETVKFLDQQIRGDNKAVVTTRIVREGGQIPVDYSMLKIGGAWRIYDVKIEGVSLVSNYRSQFNEVLVNRPPDDLIEKVKKKVEQQASGAAAADDDKI